MLHVITLRKKDSGSECMHTPWRWHSRLSKSTEVGLSDVVANNTNVSTPSLTPIYPIISADCLLPVMLLLFPVIVRKLD